MEIIITHNIEERRFETIIEGVKGYVEYEPYLGGLDLTHTIVPKVIGGRGVAAALVKHTLEYAKENSLKVKPTCPYIKTYMERYKESYGGLEDSAQ